MEAIIMIRQLPTIEYKGKKYFRDDRLRQIRNVENPHDYVDFEELNGGE
jgi:hypothetical protein